MLADRVGYAFAGRVCGILASGEHGFWRSNGTQGVLPEMVLLFVLRWHSYVPRTLVLFTPRKGKKRRQPAH